MKFRNVVFRNFKYNIKKFLNYYISSSFCIMIFFILSTFMYNEEFKEYSSKIGKADGIIIISLIMISIFSIIFINYTYSCFFRTRYKEFGLYLTLGMTKGNIRTIVFIESIITTVLSIASGLIMGSFLGRVFFNFILKISDFDEIKFSFDLKAYFMTIVVFIFIFSFILIFSMVRIRKMQISEILNQGKKEEKMIKSMPLVGIIGLILVIIASVIVFKYGNSNDSDSIDKMMKMIFVSFALYIIGIYCFVSQFGNLFLTIIRKNKSVYYRNLMNATSIKHKFIQNKNILFANTVLIMIVIFTVGLYYNLYNRSLVHQPYDISYPEVLNINNLSENKIQDIIRNEDVLLEKKEAFEFIYSGKSLLEKSYDSSDFPKKIIIISDKQCNDIFETNFKIEESSAISVNLYDKNILQEQEIIKDNRIKLKFNNKEYNFNIQKEKNSFIIPWFYHLLYNTVIVNEKDYDSIKKETPKEYIGRYNVFKFKDWTKTEDLTNKLQAELDNNNDSSKLFEDISIWGKRDFKDFKTQSRVIESNNRKKANAFQFFVFGFISILFFLASCGITYIKLNTDIEDDKEIYKKINGIGITENEMKVQIFKQNLLMFFFPLIIGSIVAYSSLFTVFSLTKCSFGEYIQCFYVFLVFFIIELIYYIFSSQRYYYKINKEINKL